MPLTEHDSKFLEALLDFGALKEIGLNPSFNLETFPNGRNRPRFVQYTGKDTFEDTPFRFPKQEMASVHLYYFSINRGNSFVRVYGCDLKNNPTKEEIVSRWISDATSSNPSNTPTPGRLYTSLDSVEWDKPGWLAFAISPLEWKFFEEDIQGKTVNFSLYFREYKDESFRRHKNISFFNCHTILVELEDGSRFPVMFVENHHIRADYRPFRVRNRDDDRNHHDHYKFDIYVKVPIDGDDTDKYLTLIIDPSGKNTGP